MPEIAKGFCKSSDPVTVYTAEHTMILTDLQKELQIKTLADAPMGRMVGIPEVLTFGQNFIRTFGGKRVIDVGTFTGASAFAWALAVPEDGEVYTFDVDHSNFKKFGVPILSKSPETFKKIKAIEGPALASLDKLITEGQSGTFDFAFIDADKETYPMYYERAVTLLRSGGVIFVDNSLRGGSVADPAKRENDTACAAIHETNEKIFFDTRTRSALLSLGDGTHVAFKI